MPRQPRWTDAELLEAVASSKTWTEVAQRLHLSAGGGTHATLRRHAARLGADTEHLPDVTHRRRGARRFTDAQLASAVATSTTVAGVLRSLGYTPSGGMHRYIVGLIRQNGLSTDHFVGRGWSRGTSRPRPAPTPLEHVLTRESTVRGSRLLRRLIANGLKDACCESCRNDGWLGQPMPLELHHINGDHTDNRLENLAALCPNCHALTSTYAGRNRGRVVELAYTAALGAVASA